MNRLLSNLIQEIPRRLLCSLALVCLLSGQLLAAEREISGKIVSAEDKNPLPGVTIIVKGNNTIGTATDTEGKFKLTIPDQATLILSYIGYISRKSW